MSFSAATLGIVVPIQRSRDLIQLRVSWIFDKSLDARE